MRVAGMAGRGFAVAFVAKRGGGGFGWRLRWV